MENIININAFSRTSALRCSLCFACSGYSYTEHYVYIFYLPHRQGVIIYQIVQNFVANLSKKGCWQDSAD